MKPNLSPHTGLQRLASWISDSILALKVICSVIPNVHLSSCGCGAGPGGSSDCSFLNSNQQRGNNCGCIRSNTVYAMKT